MDLGIKGRRALVTGASSGLGAAAATALAAEGVEVIINGRDQARLDAAGHKIHEETGRWPVLIAGDLSMTGEPARIVKEAGPIDILVANSGGPPPGQFLDHAEERWQESNDLVLNPAINLSRAALEGMVDRQWGRVIFITSVGVLQPIDTLILSNTYRAAVAGLCKTLSNNYARHGITFNCVCPGYTATERLNSLAETMAQQTKQSRDEVIAGFAANAPAQRVGQPEELAALITFLAGVPAAYVTGAAIACDGGLYKGLV